MSLEQSEKAAGSPTVASVSDPSERPAASRVARNTVLRAAAEVIGKIASVVLFAYVARKLGREVLGDFVFAMAFTQLMWPVAGFGLDRMLLRDVARDRSVVDQRFYDIAGFKLVVGFLAIAGCVGVAAIAGYSSRVLILVAILGAALVTVLLSSTAQTVFQAYEHNEFFFAAAVPNKIFASIFGVGVLLLGGNIIGVAIGNLAASLIGLVIAWALLYRYFRKPDLRVHPRSWWRMARTSGPFGLQEVFGQIVFRFDTVLLSLMTSAFVVASYGAAYRLLEASLFLAWSVGNSVLPMYSYLSKAADAEAEQHGETDAKPAAVGQPSLERAFEGSLKFLLVIMVPVAVVLFVCAQPIISLIFGLPQYADAVTVLRWLAFAIVAYGIGHLSGLLILVHLPGRITVIITAVAAVFNTALNLVLIPMYKAEGAAIATLLTETSLAAAALFFAVRVSGPLRWRSILMGVITSGVAMGFVMSLFSTHLEFALPIGAVTYLVVLVAIESQTSRGDFQAVRQMIGRGQQAITGQT
jgi:O-antigen/teichoic acid export membrane protein